MLSSDHMQCTTCYSIWKMDNILLCNVMQNWSFLNCKLVSKIILFYCCLFVVKECGQQKKINYIMLIMFTFFITDNCFLLTWCIKLLKDIFHSFPSNIS